MRYTIFITTVGFFLVMTAGHAFAQVGARAASGSDLLKVGEGSLAKGNFTAAAGEFGRALRTNDLTDAQVARALYQRGVAHEKTARPAQAIADITNALFLEGLSGAERAKAYLSRGRAYESVGMSDLARSDISRAKSGGISQSQIARASQPSAAAGQAAGPSFSTSVQGAGQRAPDRNTRVATFDTQTRAPAPPTPEIPRFRTTIVPNNTRAPAPGTRTAAVSQNTSAPAGWNTASQQGDGAPAPTNQPPQKPKGKVSGFLGGLWEKTKDKVGRKNKEESAAPPPPAAPSQAAPQWNQTTNTANRPPAVAPVRTARVSPPAPVQTRAASQGSGYRIQLAALRSETEAQATWKRLSSRHKNFLGNRQPNIVRTELGGLGTFYRVQLGPFNSKNESEELCKNFKKGGLDCFLLAP